MRSTNRLGLALLVVCGICAGCQTSRMGGLNPFYRTERTSFLTPPKRIASIRDVAEQSTGEDTPEQDALVRDLVTPLAAEKDPLVRQTILETAAEFNTTMAQRALLAGLSDESAHVREASCRLLATHPVPQAAEALAARAREDESIDVRIAAARALGPNGATEQQLLPLLEDPNPAMQLVGVEAMKRKTGQDYGGDVAAYIALARGEAPAGKQPTSVANRLPGWVPFF